MSVLTNFKSFLIDSMLFANSRLARGGKTRRKTPTEENLFHHSESLFESLECFHPFVNSQRQLIYGNHVDDDEEILMNHLAIK